MPNLTAEQVFALHPKIRWAGLASEQGEVIFVGMRPGVESLSPQDADHSFVQMGPLLLTGVLERFAPWAGPLEIVVSTYQKVALIVTRIHKQYLALTVAKEDVGVLPELITRLVDLAK